MAERLIAAVLKTVEDLRPPGVRISLSPPYKNLTSCKEIIFTRGFLCLICKTKKLLGFAVFTQRPAGQRSSLRNSNKCCSISDEAGCGCLLPSLNVVLGIMQFRNNAVLSVKLFLRISNLQALIVLRKPQTKAVPLKKILNFKNAAIPKKPGNQFSLFCG